MFRNSHCAQVALSADRPSFVQRRDIMALIPSYIRRRLVYPGDIPRIEGFQDLFIFLNTDPDTAVLRGQIIVYFEGSPALRNQLSQCFSPLATRLVSHYTTASTGNPGVMSPRLYPAPVNDRGKCNPCLPHDSSHPVGQVGLRMCSATVMMLGLFCLLTAPGSCGNGTS